MQLKIQIFFNAAASFTHAVSVFWAISAYRGRHARVVRRQVFRAQLLLQSEQRPALQNLLSHLCPALESMKESRSVRWSVDVDPQDMI